MLTVDLVFPPSSTGSENYSSEPPLGPVALYSSLPEEWRCSTRFLDSTVLSPTELKAALLSRQADVVAMSCSSFNYATALELAALARSWGAWTVFGGIHVTHTKGAILQRMRRGLRPIDYLVTGYGEPTFFPLLEALESGADPEGIPNLHFIDGERVVSSGTTYPRRGRDPLLAPLDFDPIDFEVYEARFNRLGNLQHVKVPGSTFTQRGCAYVGGRKCVFCAIEQVNPRRPAELVEEEFVALIQDKKVDHIRINDGDFTASPRHVRAVLNAATRAAKRTARDASFYCLGRADELDEDRVEDLRRLNVVSVFIGYESGSDRMLRIMQKHTTVEQNLAATRLLDGNGIDVTAAGIVLGAEGESEQSLNETLAFVAELGGIGNVRSLTATPLVPLPGSPSFVRLLSVLEKEDPHLASALKDEDVFDLWNLAEIWNRHMCEVSLSRVLTVADEIEEKVERAIRWFRWDAGSGREETRGAGI